VCDLLTEESKNLTTCEVKQEAPLRDSTILDVKGKLVEFAFYMEKQGYARETIRGNNSCLRALLTRKADLLDPESVKEALAKEQRWSQNRRRNIINAYTLFLKINRTQWEKPLCNVVRKIPFIPTEQEIDQLIAGCPKKTATFLQLLKETAMRSGEAKRLKWTDIDFQRRLITLNDPEKNGLPRLWNNPTSKLLDMLNALPRSSIYVFGSASSNTIKSTFNKARRRIANKLQNPRLLQIHFHTLRHWKATMEYHNTKDLLHTMAFLGHKKSDTTLLYIQLDQKLLDMLNALPRSSIYVFGSASSNTIKSTFNKARRRIANKLQNPRLLQIHFHTLRHWKATMEYHNTKDLLHTMAFLGHKKSDTTLLYIQLDQKLFKQSDDSFTTKIAHDVGEAAALVEVGFEYVTGEYGDGGKLFRKPK
jgi:integrase